MYTLPAVIQNINNSKLQNKCKKIQQSFDYFSQNGYFILKFFQKNFLSSDFAMPLKQVFDQHVPS